MNSSLKLGAAYHGSRILSDVTKAMADMARDNLNLVVHMFSHNDWERHKNRMADIVKASKDAGLEVWIDNWGLGGPPGDKSHFLAAKPDSHLYFSNGEMSPDTACLNSPDFREFTKQWLEAVAELGAKTVFWDEPQLPIKKTPNGNVFSCCCPHCKKLFESMYNIPMPQGYIDGYELSNELEKFRLFTVSSYFREVTDYSHSLGMSNVVCVMVGQQHGISLETLDSLCSVPHLENIGSDPYWSSTRQDDVYDFVYTKTLDTLDVAKRFNKQHNIWIKAYSIPRGREEDIVTAAHAAYDAGARTLIAWSYMGGEANDYASQNPMVSWRKTVDGFNRVLNIERDRVLEIKRKRAAAL